MSSFFQDIRFSLRLLARTPAFTITAIAVLALAIGANAAIFSLVDELLWTSPSYPHAEQVVQLYSQDKRNPSSYRLFSYPTYRDLAGQDSVFSGVLAHTMTMVSVGERTTSRRTFAGIISSNFFSVLGVPLVQGRPFTAEEEAPSSHIPVVIVSHLYWRRTGFDPALIGKTVRVNEQVFTIVGITPEHFSGTMMLLGPELYFPLGMHDALGGDILKGSAKRSLAERGDHQLFLVARLKPGVTMATATPVLQGLAANLEKRFPAEQKDQTFIMAPLPRLSTSTAPARDRGLTVLGSLLIGMAAIVLLIACLNLANLLLARGHARRKEIAIRLALGGGRRRLVRQLLTEGALLALLGGAGGFACALWGTGLLINSISTRFPLALFFHGAANPALFAAALGFCGLATLGFALGPALQLTRDASIDDLKQQAGEDAGAARRRWRWLPRHPMLTAQIALSLGLLITAGLFVRGAVKAGNVDTGFKTDRTFLVEVDASLSGYDEPRALQAYAQIDERLARLPGVEASAIGSVVPFGMISMERDVRRAGVHVEPGAHPATAAEGRAFVGRWSSVGADYFQTLGLPLLRGRVFVATECGQTGAPKVAIIDEGLARRLFPDGDALGQRITFANPGDAADKSAADGLEVVGIVPATRWGLFDAKDMGSIYVPFAQGYMSNVFFHVRAATSIVGHESAWLDTLRREVRTAAPNVGVFSVVTFGQHLERSLELWIVRIGATLFGLFGALALLLATVGIYGVKSYGITRRTREIGIRVALGAEPGRVRRMILREGLATTLLGLAIGVLLGLALGQACAGLLYDVSPRDPTALMVAPTVLLLATLVASWIPARRATQVSPLVALRTE